MTKCMAILMALAVAATAVATVGAQDVDLTAGVAYVREGFSLEWVFHEPERTDTAWLRVAGSPGDRPVVMRDLGLPGVPVPTLFPPVGRGPAARYCIVMPFDVDASLLASSGGVGLYLGGVGMDWQVYLNGNMLRDDTHLDRDGRLTTERAVKGALLDVDTRYLSVGRNVLAFMVAGDPHDGRTGLFAGSPYLIGSYERLAGRRVESFRLMLVGIYFFFALYHAGLFAMRRKERSYLFYGIGTMALSVYLLCNSFIVYDIVRDTRIIAGLEMVALFAIVPAFTAFFDATTGGRISLFTKLCTGVYAVAAAAQVFLWREAFLMFWRWTVALPVLYVVVFDLVLPMAREYRRRVGSLPPGTGAWKRLARGLEGSDSGKLLLATLVIGAFLAIDALGRGTGSTVSYSDLGFLLLVFGTAAVLAGRFVRVYRDVEGLKVDLERRVTARTGELETTLAAQEDLSVRLSETNAKLRAATDESTKDMRVAAQVQQGFFPRTAPRTAAWEAAFAFLPAGGISGDFYDFYLRDGRLDGLVLGDVSGHGIASGLITVLARSIFHRNFYDRKRRSLGAILESINEELIHELDAVENYLTAALLRLGEDGTVEYASAAHPEILYRSATRRKAIPLRTPAGQEFKGPPLGRGGFEAPYGSIRFTMKPGDLILMHTDGLDESRNVDGEPFGLNGILEAMTESSADDASQLLDFIMREWRFHTSGTDVADDTTAVLLRKL